MFRKALPPQSVHSLRSLMQIRPALVPLARYASDIRFPRDAQAPYRLPGGTSGDAGDASKNFTYFVTGSASSLLLAGGKGLAQSLVSTMSASADVLAMANVEVDLNTIEEGSCLVVKWRGKPLFIRKRTEAEIAAARDAPMSELKDPEADDVRVKEGRSDVLVLLGVCTHLGCVPLNGQGEYGGWFCPCHGSHYDTSGRIRKGPAPLNLEIPPYKYLDDEHIVVGVD